ncbi:S41 family peptidase [Parapusillimonas granuli]|uniref:S41 family peptidase n=1 Tax=Parapusillimonas granuli TaxID=380911 RepID=A0A853G218_9BURK|nr:S41 family peptidase [Parapusillimonas granuli]MBB5214761.1 carboxyl-terminal processing protease [Parapusillimonas granuli]MEB2397991.1 S41 family peptidase [Alcaligenaceae bacterium]NYT48831.1 S41 family peptidase [Parapusillimonas granuli]
MSTRRLRGFGLVVAGALGGVLISLGITAAAQRGEPLPLKELQQFANVFAAIKASYVEPVADDKLINDAIKGMFSDLDPHSTYLDAEAFKEMEAITQGGFGGLGIEIGSEDGMPKVISPIEDTPAARAGILSGDLITHIDGKPTKGMTLNDAIKLMRGEPKTSIVLTIKRAGVDKPLVITIVRDLIKVRSVRSKMLDNDIGYVRIAQFQERTVEDLARQLTELGSKKQPKALVLDLRNDPGGLLDGAIGVSSAFLPPDILVVSTKGRIPSSNREYFSKPVGFTSNLLNGEPPNRVRVPEWVKTIPMVVLVNVGSASASEIVAGALQDHGRAKILGNRTFGKGSVQSVLPLSEDTGIKLTTARYYTPKGRSIQVTGVDPDITVDDTAQGNLFRLPREVDLQRHLINSGVVEDPAEEAADDDGKPKPKMFEFGGGDDYQLMQAINFLEGRPVKKSDPSMVAKADKPADKAQGSTKGNSSGAEKKSPVKAAEAPKVLRYRVTPQGVVPVQP